MTEVLPAEIAREIIREHARERHGAVPADVLGAGADALRVGAAGSGGVPAGGDGRPVVADGIVQRVNPACGDRVTLRVTVRALVDGDIVSGVEWEGRGCEVSQASASMLADALPGTSLADAKERIRSFIEFVRQQHDAEHAPEGIGDAVALAGVGRFPLRGTCATLAWHAALDALESP